MYSYPKEKYSALARISKVLLATLIFSLFTVPALPSAHAVNDGNIACTSGSVTVQNNIVTTNNGCTGTVEIPYGVTSIVPVITALNFSSVVVNFKCSVSGQFTTQIGIVNKDDSINRTCTGTANIPEGITEIGDDAFRLNIGNPSFTRVNFPSTLTRIGNQAFSENIAVESYNFAPNSQLTHIGVRSFYSNRVVAFTIPASVTTIAAEAFESNMNLIFLKFESGSQLITIGSQAFKGCGQLAIVTIPQTVTYIGDLAFYQTALGDITFLGGRPLGTGDIIQRVSLVPTAHVSVNETGTAVDPLTWSGNNSFFWRGFDLVGTAGPAFPPPIVSSPADGTTFRGQVGVSFQLDMNIASGYNYVVATASNTTLPAGLVLNSSSGTITGTPTVAGTSSVDFTVTDANSGVEMVSNITFVIRSAFSGTVTLSTSHTYLLYTSNLSVNARISTNAPDNYIAGVFEKSFGAYGDDNFHLTGGINRIDETNIFLYGLYSDDFTYEYEIVVRIYPANTSGNISYSDTSYLASLTILITDTPPPPSNDNSPSITVAMPSIPDPVQKSEIAQSTPVITDSGTARLVTIFGTFNEVIKSIQLDGKSITSDSWIQTLTSLLIKLPLGTTGQYSVQIYNGAVPVLPAREVTISASVTKPVESAPVESPTPTPSPKPTPTTPAKTPSKTKATTITCVKGKTVKTIKGNAPKCPVGYKKR